MVWADCGAGGRGGAEVSEPCTELDSLRQQVAEARALTTVGVKAAISALLAVEEALKAIQPRNALAPRDPHLDIAEAHVREGLGVLREAFEDKPHGA